MNASALDFGDEAELGDESPQFVQVEVAGPDEQQFIVYTDWMEERWRHSL